MADRRGASRRAAVGVAAAAAGSVGLYLRVLRPQLLYWGATPHERQRSLPGDGVVSTPLAMVTHAITINAPTEAVWPWIAQMGSQDVGRAGWYSYDRLDNAGVGSATTLLPDVSAPAVGTALVADPNFAWTVRALEPGRSLALELRAGDRRLRAHVSWVLVVEPAAGGRTRLIERSWWDMRPRRLGAPLSALFEPIDFLMMRRHHLNLKQRAEALAGERGRSGATLRAVL